MNKRFVDDNGNAAPNPLHYDGKTIINPTDEQYIAAGYHEYVPPTPQPYVPTYEEKVVQLVRERYSIDDELAILRQRDTKPAEFATYYDYVEDCKVRAKEN